MIVLNFPICSFFVLFKLLKHIFNCQEEVGFGVDQVGFYIEDLLLETRTGGEDEDLQDLEDDEVSVSILQAFQYKVIQGYKISFLKSCFYVF